MNWLAQHSGQLAVLLDLILVALVVAFARLSPRGRRLLSAAIAEQVGREVAKQLKPLREDVAALRRHLQPVPAEVPDVATNRIELVIVEE